MKSKNNIPAIIGKLLPWERRHIVNTLGISENIISFLNETGMSREEFAKRFNLTLDECNKFINGEWEYSLSDTGKLEMLWTDFRRKNLHVDVIEVVNQEKYKDKYQNQDQL